ncbi:MAG: alpha/beta hydrolase family protein [Candidatus Omnitrophota bacterium]
MKIFNSICRLKANTPYAIAMALGMVLQSEMCYSQDFPRSQWHEQQQTDHEIVQYFYQRARAKVEGLRKSIPPDMFLQKTEKIRESLKTTYLMPTVAGNHEVTLVREVTVDGIPVEMRLLKILPGVYSTLWIYKPVDGKERHPAVFYLPGHGDPAFDPVLQKRALGFAKQGYIAVLVEPFGQTELTDVPLKYEYHGCASMAYLLTTGKSLLGIIMASYTVDLSYLCSRSDVNRDQVVVMGGSMGGTHTLWLTAIDTRVKAAVPVSAATLTEPKYGLFQHCLCDLMVGLFNVADAEIIRGLIAPRPLLVIYPSPLEVPLAEEKFLLYSEGVAWGDKTVTKYSLTNEQMAQLYPYAREIYGLKKASDRFKEIKVEGPHGDARQYRELAYGWFAHFLMERDTASPIPEQPLSPIQDVKKAQLTLQFWPDGNRPADLLGPTAYTQKETSALVAKLPKPPANPEDAQRLGAKLKDDINNLLGVRAFQGDAKFSREGEITLDAGVVASKYAVEAEPGAITHILVFRPSPGIPPNGRLYVLLHPQGVIATANSVERMQLTNKGYWVVCADLRGMGSWSAIHESYVGLRERALCMGALKLGETVAGWWMNDLLAVVSIASKITGTAVDVTVRGERETGLVAILAASQSQSIKTVEVNGLLASYYSANGYGEPYEYGKPTPTRTGYGSMVPCIPNILKYADIPQLAALVCPRPLTITEPMWASGEMVSGSGLDLSGVFAWTRRFYEVSGYPGNLAVE